MSQRAARDRHRTPLCRRCRGPGPLPAFVGGDAAGARPGPRSRRPSPAGWTIAPPDFVGVGTARSGTTWWDSAHPRAPGRGARGRRAQGGPLLRPVLAGRVHGRGRRGVPRVLRAAGGQAGRRVDARLHARPVDAAAAPAGRAGRPAAGAAAGPGRALPERPHPRREPPDRRRQRRGPPPTPGFQRGVYADQLLRLWRSFPREQMLVLQFERCVRDARRGAAAHLHVPGPGPGRGRRHRRGDRGQRIARPQGGPVAWTSGPRSCARYAPENRRLAATSWATTWTCRCGRRRDEQPRARACGARSCADRARGTASAARSPLGPPDPPDCPANQRIGPPDFVGIGAQKAGTSWWNALLGAHPDVHAHEGPAQGAPLLRRAVGAAVVRGGRHPLRALLPAALAAALTGEWTPGYMIDFWTPGLIARAAPQARILVLLRDPIDRFRSGLTHTDDATLASLSPPGRGGRLPARPVCPAAAARVRCVPAGAGAACSSTRPAGRTRRGSWPAPSRSWGCAPVDLPPSTFAREVNPTTGTKVELTAGLRGRAPGRATPSTSSELRDARAGPGPGALADRAGRRPGLRGRIAPGAGPGDRRERAHTGSWRVAVRGRSPAAQAPIRKGSSDVPGARRPSSCSSCCGDQRLLHGPPRARAEPGPGRLARDRVASAVPTLPPRVTPARPHAGPHRPRPCHADADRHARSPPPPLGRRSPSASSARRPRGRPPHPTWTWRAWCVAPRTSRWTCWRASSGPAMTPTSCWARRRSPPRSRCCTPAPAVRPRPRSSRRPGPRPAALPPQRRVQHAGPGASVPREPQGHAEHRQPAVRAGRVPVPGRVPGHRHPPVRRTARERGLHAQGEGRDEAHQRLDRGPHERAHHGRHPAGPAERRHAPGARQRHVPQGRVAPEVREGLHRSPRPFFRPDGTTVKVPTMYQSATFPAAFTDTYTALELPYVGNDLAMLLVMPDDPTTFLRGPGCGRACRRSWTASRPRSRCRAITFGTVERVPAAVLGADPGGAQAAAPEDGHARRVDPGRRGPDGHRGPCGHR